MGILVGDIGGTKSYLALLDEGNPRKRIFEKRYESRKFEDFVPIVQDFLLNLSLEKGVIKKACFGVAGPVYEGRCKTTNLPWILDVKEIAKATSIDHVAFLNDLEAMAYGIPLLQEDEVVVLHTGEQKIGNRALLAAGTGLGEVGLFWNGKEHIPFASEGGHADLAPRDELEMELLRYLTDQFGHVSYERVVSGPGIYQLYRFLVDMRLEEEDPEVRRAFAETDPPQVIAQLAMGDEDPVANRAVEWFISFYGAEAGNVALKFLAVGGIYIGGSIAVYLAPLLKRGGFMRAFTEKGRFAPLLKDIPVRIILNQETALLGAANYILTL